MGASISGGQASESALSVRASCERRVPSFGSFFSWIHVDSESGTRLSRNPDATVDPSSVSGTGRCVRAKVRLTVHVESWPLGWEAASPLGCYLPVLAWPARPAEPRRSPGADGTSDSEHPVVVSQMPRLGKPPRPCHRPPGRPGFRRDVPSVPPPTPKKVAAASTRAGARLI